MELELIDRERRVVERRIRAARFPAVKSFDTFDFTAIRSQQDAGAGTRALRVHAAPGEHHRARQQRHRQDSCRPALRWPGSWPAPPWGRRLARRGSPWRFTTAASLVTQLMEARDERRLLKPQRDLQAVKLLIVDELGYVPLSATGAELLFEAFSQRYAGLDHHHLEPPFRGLDIGSGIGAAHRRPARQAHPPRQHPDPEPRQLSPQAVGRTPTHVGQGGAKPGYRRDRRFRHRRGHNRMIRNSQRLAWRYSAPLA